MVRRAAPAAGRRALRRDQVARPGDRPVGARCARAAWWYVTRTVEGQLPDPLPRPRRAATGEPTSVLLDENAEAAGARLLRRRRRSIVSPDHTLLAWSSDVDGGERYTLRVRDLATGADLADELTGHLGVGRRRLVGRRRVAVLRPARRADAPVPVWRHVSARRRPTTCSCSRSPTSASSSASARRAASEWIVIAIVESNARPRRGWCPADDARRGAASSFAASGRRRRVRVDHWGDRFVVAHQPRRGGLPRDDGTARRARRVDRAGRPRAGPADHRRRAVRRPPRAPRVARRPDAAARRCSATARRACSTSATSRTTSSSAPTRSGRPRRCASATSRSPRRRRCTTTTCATGERTLLKQTPTPNVDLDRYTLDAQWADGGRRHGGCRSTSCATSTRRSTARRRAWSTATAPTSRRCRRGSRRAAVAARPRRACGRSPILAAAASSAGAWYLDGKLLHKRNTFTDTIAVRRAPRRRAASPTAPRLAIRGGSAGGLLVGACVTMRPDLFAAAVAEVPFVDVVTTMSDPTLPLTVTEWEEWGDPRARAVRQLHGRLLAVRQHAPPADATRRCTSPPGSTTRGSSYHEPAKWVAKLRAVGAGTDAPAAAAHRDGRRPRRPERPLRRLARRGPHPHLPAHHPLGRKISTSIFERSCTNSRTGIRDGRHL